MDEPRVHDGRASLTLLNAMPEIERAEAWLEAVGEEFAVPSEAVARLQVAMDEVLTNIISHGLAGVSEGTRNIWLDVTVNSARIELRVSDDGPPFDPTSVRPALAQARIVARQIGGVGLLFVRSLVDDLQFDRVDGRNDLTMSKGWLPQPIEGDCALEILEAEAAGSAIVHVAGKVNSVNARELGERLQGLLDKGYRSMVVDLARLDHMTSAGFRSLLRADKQAEDRDCKMVLCGLQGLTLELFEVGGFLDMFCIAESRDDALRQVAR
jgi:serine/threonine-protein kinase RsbW